MSLPAMTAWRAALAPAVFATIFALTKLSERVGVPVAFCASKALLGIPCPGCGVTTSIDALLRGDLHASIAANAAGPVVAAFAIAQLVIAFAAGPAVHRMTRFTDQALATALITAWLIRLI